MQDDIAERLRRIERQINLVRGQKARAVDGLNNLDDRLEQLEIEFKQLAELLDQSGNAEAEKSAIHTAPPMMEARMSAVVPPVGDSEVSMDSLAPEPCVEQSASEPEVRFPAASLFESQRQAEERESVLGTRWLSRIGIVVLLLGIAMALAYTFPHFSNSLKILTGFVVAGMLYGVGHRLYGQTAVLGRILQGGGLSVGYASLFAVFFIPQVQLIDLPILGVFSLFCYVAGMLWVAHRLNSQTVAILSTAFGYYTAPYAGDQGIQLIAAGILSLATVFVTRLHSEWQAMSKINWAGAMITYFSASFYGQLSLIAYQAYLVYTALLFHVVSLLRGQRGDLVLGQLNTLVFYGLFLIRTPDLKPHGGILELSIAAVQFGSLWVLKKLDRETDCKELAHGLLLNTLLLSGVATCRHFGAGMKSPVFAAEALSLALFAAKSRYKQLMVIFAYLGLFMAYFTFWDGWNSLPEPALFFGALWVAGVTLVIEYGPLRNHSEGSGLMLILAAHALMLITLLKVTDENLRTLALCLEGFASLGAGFALRRKCYRMIGLGILFACGGLSLLVDMIRLETLYKILLFIVLGVGLLAGSYGYSRLARHLEKEDSLPVMAQSEENL